MVYLLLKDDDVHYISVLHVWMSYKIILAGSRFGQISNIIMLGEIPQIIELKWRYNADCENKMLLDERN